MSNADLVEPRECLCERACIIEVEVVSCVETESEQVCSLCRGSVCFECSIGVQSKEFGIGSCVEFYSVSSGFGSELDHGGVRVNED